MPKITVRDTFKDFHTFTGNVYAVEQDGGCKVFERRPDGSSTLRQSFGPHIFGWLKTEQDKPSDIVDAPAPSIDRYTQAGLQTLSGKPPSLDTGDYDINQDKLPDYDLIAFEPDHKDNEGLANVPGGVLSLEPGTVPGQVPPPAKKTPRARPSQAKPKPDAAQATMAAAVAEGLIPPAMDKDNSNIVIEPKEEEGPAPKLDDLLASGVIKKGMAVDNNVPHETDISADLADTVIDPPIREVDIEATLSQAEEKHQSRKACETCRGRGVVPDPESQDPLDTMICPVC